MGAAQTVHGGHLLVGTEDRVGDGDLSSLTGSPSVPGISESGGGGDAEHAEETGTSPSN